MYLLGAWLVEPTARRISRGSETSRLSPKAMGVLTALREAQGRVLSRRELLEEVWPDVTVGEEVLTHAIAELRKALGDHPQAPRYIETVPKCGYRLTADSGMPPTESLNLENYVAYLEGCELFFRGGRRNVSGAIETFNTILESDPGYAPAHAGLARSLFFMDFYFGLPGDNRAHIEQCGRSAVAFDPTSPEAQSALGLAVAAMGHYDAGLAEFTVALRLNPHLAETHYLLGRVCFAGGDYRMAAAMLERSAELRPDDFHSLMLAAKARRFLADEVRTRTNFIKAKTRIEAQLRMDGEDRRALCDLVCCMIELGEAPAGVEMAEDLLTDPDPNDYYLVGGLARAGETAMALDCMEYVLEEGWRHRAWLKHDRDLDSLRQEPKFRRMTDSVRWF